MHGTIVGVLRGGPSREHDVSLKTGHAILTNLSPERYTTRDIYIDRKGTWHIGGKATTPDKALRSIDVAVLGLHGEYGEDGEVQKVLERYGVPFTGSSSFPSYLAMHKVLAKEKAKEHGLKTAKYRFIEPGADVDAEVREISRTFLQPVVVKPVKWGSSVGVSIVGGHSAVHKAVTDILEDSGGILVEELIRGTEATAGVVEGLRGEELYALPPIEIIPPETDFFSYEAKYSGGTREICPGRFKKEVTKELMELARTMHNALGLRHYSRSDFIVSKNGIYYLETNTLPGMTEQSLLPQSLAAVGVKFGDFLEHLIELALRRRRA